ncbi:acyl carrier protein [Streptomyces roseoverticillatus]|uniref:acyl carrier protein n=1 Tax=Streptomyces roseoverticillatus TaxID=66429 RepID=UPI001F3A67AC|nr:acyl carrier protein [Streptomyces roseoverticillatus]MCF3103004.1 acyl carrier protein [Streptomyces roseoverticillatus]
MAVGRLGWDQARAFLPGLSEPRTAELLGEDTGSTTDSPASTVRPTDPAQAADILAELLARVLHTGPQRIDRRRPLEQTGIESLMATDLAALIRRRLGCTIPVMELLGTASVSTLADRIVPRTAESHGRAAAESP